MDLHVGDQVSIVEGAEVARCEALGRGAGDDAEEFGARIKKQ